MTAPRTLPMPKVTEAQFQQQVIDLAHIFGWRAAAFRAAQTGRGWRTPVQGDGKGWLDLTLLRGNRLIVAELKVGKNKLSPEQTDWLEAWRECPFVEAHVWRPEDLDDIAKVLR